MARVISKKEYVRLFEKRSIILNKDKGSKRPASTGAILDMTGLKGYLQNLLRKGRDDEGRFLGIVESKRHEASEARKRWKSFNEAQAPHARKKSLMGIFWTPSIVLKQRFWLSKRNAACSIKLSRNMKLKKKSRMRKQNPK